MPHDRVTDSQSPSASPRPALIPLQGASTSTDLDTYTGPPISVDYAYSALQIEDRYLDDDMILAVYQIHVSRFTVCYVVIMYIEILTTNNLFVFNIRRMMDKSIHVIVSVYVLLVKIVEVRKFLTIWDNPHMHQLIQVR